MSTPRAPTAAPKTLGVWRHRLFQVAVALKGIDGILELAGGILLLVFGRSGVNRAIRFLTQHELTEDPHDAVAGFLVHQTAHLGLGTIHFAAAYLLVHGVVKVGLVVGLLRERRWVFPVALLFLFGFVGYQLYRIAHHPSLGLEALTALDVIVIVLVWLEWRALPAPA